MQHQEIAVLAFNNISPFHLSVPCLVFENRAGLPKQGASQNSEKIVR